MWHLDSLAIRTFSGCFHSKKNLQRAGGSSIGASASSCGDVDVWSWVASAAFLATCCEAGQKPIRIPELSSMQWDQLQKIDSKCASPIFPTHELVGVFFVLHTILLLKCPKGGARVWREFVPIQSLSSLAYSCIKLINRMIYFYEILTAINWHRWK